ncbi:hypothetical protein [Methanoculleus chikugoensis]|uniref:ATP-binding protein n=1 Tax=Methanoculleus chikugoensis TaxID=118126 RepID=UPI001FB4FEA7|nr:ATP-binding protein [Methanoculleus chikugoensis]
MLFSDRLEIWNPPGILPPSLTLEKLRQAHGSVPANPPLLAEPMYLAGYIERMGTGTRDMIRHCTEPGCPSRSLPSAMGSGRLFAGLWLPARHHSQSHSQSHLKREFWCS